MGSERTLPEKYPEGVRPARELKAIFARCLEENRWLVMEGAELLCESPVCVTRLDEIVCPTPLFEERVRQLCKQLFACKTEEEVVELAQQLKALLHDNIEQLGGSERNFKPA